ncbi:MAG: OadG family protein [Bacteroidetes bacterium]|nr:OadG family protein [Bacteroidota bacterium]
MNPLFILLASSVEFGLTVAIVGFSIVLSSLTLLVFVFLRLPKLINILLKKRNKKSSKQDESTGEEYLEGNATAAISLALHLYFNELHDEESNIVTIKRIKKAYSPWSSKIYSVNQNWPKQ